MNLLPAPSSEGHLDVGTQRRGDPLDERQAESGALRGGVRGVRAW